jgi:hypothetical protein
MNDQFNYTASTLSTEELKARIEDRPKYLPETIEASIDELKIRGVEFSDEELEVINADLQAHRANALLPAKAHFNSSISYKNALVIDPAAPSLYSRRAIYFFTIFFGALFGSILLIMNLIKLRNYKDILWVVVFGVALTAIPITLAEYANTGTSLGFLFGLISAACIDYFFWDKFIGPVFYRARKIWWPLAIALAFLALIILAMVNGDAALDTNVK